MYVQNMVWRQQNFVMKHIAQKCFCYLRFLVRHISDWCLPDHIIRSLEFAVNFDYCNSHGDKIEIGPDKTKLMTYSPNGFQREIKIKGQRLEEVQNLKYLGAIISYMYIN